MDYNGLQMVPDYNRLLQYWTQIFFLQLLLCIPQQMFPITTKYNISNAFTKIIIKLRPITIEISKPNNQKRCEIVYWFNQSVYSNLKWLHESDGWDDGIDLQEKAKNHFRFLIKKFKFGVMRISDATVRQV